jgi:hypothetical protein
MGPSSDPGRRLAVGAGPIPGLHRDAKLHQIDGREEVQGKEVSGLPQGVGRMLRLH